MNPRFGHTQPALELDNVTIAYTTTPVVEGVSLRVAAGEWLGLIGPNGAGKSSLLRAVAGLVPHRGTIAIDGETLPSGRRSRKRATRVAMVPQTPVIPAGMSVASYVMLGRNPHISYLGVERPNDLDVVHDILERLEFGAFAARHMDTLSGGERQRSVIARALAQQAPLLLLDEPTNGLDVGSGLQVLELVAGLCRTHGLTVVSAMHDLTLAGQFADRLAMISEHKLAACGSADQVLTEGEIGHHYGANVRVLHDDDGSVIVIPVRAAPGSAVASDLTAAHDRYESTMTAGNTTKELT